MQEQPKTQREATMPRRGYPYKRCSDPTQRKGHSLERQEEWPKKVCEEQGWFYDDTYSLVDSGRSAFHKKNLTPKAGLTRFLKLLRAGTIDPKNAVLIIENLDRLSRAQVKEAQKLFQEILESGAWICTKTPFRIYKDENCDFFDLLEPLWIMYCAYMESLKKSQRISDLWKRDRERAREKGTPISAPPPFWLVKTATGYEFSDKKPILDEMIRLSRLGRGAIRIGKAMEAAGVKSPGYSGRWNNTFVRLVLKSRELVGEYQPGVLVEGKVRPVGEPIPNYFPAVLSEEEWQALQGASKRRFRARGRPGKFGVNLFTGLVWDAESRERLQQRPAWGWVKGQRKRYCYLGRELQSRLVDYYEFEDRVLAALAMLRPEDVQEPGEVVTEREERIGVLGKRVTALQVRQKQLQADAADPAKDYLGPVLEAVSKELKAAAAERDRLKEESRSGRVEALTRAQSLVELRAETRQQQGDTADLDERIKEALPSVVSEIWVQSQKISERVRITHVQMWLRSGAVRSFCLLPKLGKGPWRPWQLESHDLRKAPFVPGTDTGNTAPMAESA